MPTDSPFLYLCRKKGKGGRGGEVDDKAEGGDVKSGGGARRKYRAIMPKVDGAVGIKT